MKKPNHRLIAFLFTLSFLLQMAILLQSALVYHERTKDDLSRLLSDQLANSIAIALSKQDPIAIAIILNQYETIPTLAKIEIYNAKHEKLASAGQHPRESMPPIGRKIRWDNQDVGSISIGMVRFDWRQAVLQLLIYLILSALLWLAIYALTMHQLYSWYHTARQLMEKIPSHSSQHPIFEDATFEEPMPTTTTMTSKPNKDPSIIARLNQQSGAHINPEAYPLVMILQYSDPSQLFETLSPGIARPYFELCQLLLTRALDKLNLESKHKFVTPVIVQNFSQHGAVIGFMGRMIDAMEYAVQLGVLFNQLSEHVYQHHRKHHRFALFTQCTIAESKKNGTSAFETASHLARHSLKNKVFIHALQSHTGSIHKQFILDPVNALSMQAGDMAAIVVGITDPGIEHHLQDIFTQILQQNDTPTHSV